nr:AraC family ligand binding domain-containing protein [Bordetella genomosp. 5]
MRRHALDPALPAGRSLGRVSAEADAPRPSAGAARFWRDPALPFAESRIAQNSRACYQAHAHDTLSVGMVERGASRFSSQDRVHDLAPASVVMVPAGVVHACNPLPDAAWSYRMLHLDADWCDALWRESGERVASSTAVTRRGAASALRALTDLLHGAGGVAAKETALIEYVGGLRWIVPAAHATGTASDDTIASHPGGRGAATCSTSGNCSGGTLKRSGCRPARTPRPSARHLAMQASRPSPPGWAAA